MRKGYRGRWDTELPGLAMRNGGVLLVVLAVGAALLARSIPSWSEGSFFRPLLYGAAAVFILPGAILWVAGQRRIGSARRGRRARIARDSVKAGDDS